MREIVFIQLGKCGNKIGEKFWEVISDEHNINSCGHFFGNNILPYQRLYVYYEAAQNCRFVPRCVMVDLKQQHIHAIRRGDMGKLFNPDYCITGDKGAGNNWARGYYTEGAELLESIMDVIRWQTEACDSLQGFQMIHSIGGGTGSGLGSLLVNELHHSYRNKIINNFSVTPSLKVSQTVVEPYNAVMSLNEFIRNTDETVIFDNEALFDFSKQNFKFRRPKFNDLNQVISMTMAGVTSCFRYPGQLNTDLRKLLTNMCPYPKLHFFLPGYAPIVFSSEKNYRELSVKRLVQNLFDPKFQIAPYDPCSGKLLTCAAIFRGLVSSKEVEAAMFDIRKCNTETFATWIPNNIKTAICDIPPRGLKFSATFLANSTAITLSFQRLVQQFDAMFAKRAFVHWYTSEGMEEQEFVEAKEAVMVLCDEYLEAGGDGNDSGDSESQTNLLGENDDDDLCSTCSECQEPYCECNCRI